MSIATDINYDKKISKIEKNDLNSNESIQSNEKFNENIESILKKRVLFFSAIELLTDIMIYLVQSILVLYLNQTIAKGGMGINIKLTTYILGIFISITNLSPIIGGFISGFILSETKCILLGLICMTSGVFVLGYPSLLNINLDSGVRSNLIISLFLIAFGNGLFRTNMIASLGNIYDFRKKFKLKTKTEDDDLTKLTNKRSNGFSLQFMAINIGVFIGCILGGLLYEHYDYSLIFLISGLFGLIAILVYLLFILPVDSLFTVKKTKSENNQLIHKKKEKTFFYISACLMSVLLSVSVTISYGIINFYAHNNINRVFFGFEVPATWHNAFRCLIMILLSPVFIFIYNRVNKKFASNEGKIFLSSALIVGSYFLIEPWINAIALNSNYKASSSYLLLFDFIIAMSSIIYYPTIVSIATSLFDGMYRKVMIGIRSVFVGIGAYLGAMLSKLQVSEDPSKMFLILQISSCLLLVYYLIIFSTKSKNINI